MVTRAQFVAEARTWLGTPFQHQARVRGAGVDCVGLVIGVARDLGLADVRIADYPRTPQASRLLVECRQHMTPIALADARPGDVLLMRFRRDPQHVAVVADYVHGGLSIVHAYEGAGAVVEHRLDDAWLARVVAAFAVPGVVDE